jgi:hypothetical protein
MPLVHAAVDSLCEEGRVQLSWKGKPLTTRNGPYRISGTAPRTARDLLGLFDTRS